MWQWSFAFILVVQIHLGMHVAWALLPLCALRYAPLLHARCAFIAAVLAVVAAMLWGHWHIQRAHNAIWPAALEGQTTTIKAIVVPFSWQARGVRFGQQHYAVSVRLLPYAEGVPNRGMLHLSFYAPLDEETVALEGGTVITARVRVKRPHGTVNAGVLDSAQMDFSRGVVGRGTLVAVQQRYAPTYSLAVWREGISAKLRGVLAPWPQAQALVPALVVADRRWLSEAQWQQYRRSGTAHLMAISGLHVSLVAGLAWGISRWCLVLFLPSHQIATRIALLPALAAALLYAALAGFSLPTQRALAMAAVMMLSVARGRPSGLAAGFKIALFVVLCWQPLSVLDPSFWLSYLAIGALLLLFYLGVRGLWWRTQWLLSFALGALGAGWFGSWGALSPLANFILIPLFAWCVVPLSLLLALGVPAPILGPILAATIYVGEHWLALLAPWQGQLSAPRMGLALLLFALAVLLVCLPRLPFARVLLLLLCLPWWWPRGEWPPYGGFDFIVFDVGQGQATAIRTRHHILLFDVGPEWGSGDAGQAVLLPWLTQQPQPLALGVISHADSDHSGAFATMRQHHLGVRWLSGEPWRLPSTEPCWRGQQWQWDGVEFSVLWPPAGFRSKEHNNNSCVVRVSGRFGDVLLTGDIHKPVEFWLARHETFASNTILQVPHHGSKTSSSYAFLRQVAPRYAVVSHGYRNAFHHPAAEVVQRYRLAQVPMFSTANSGMIVFRLRGHHNSTPKRWRTDYSRPWRVLPSSESKATEER